MLVDMIKIFLVSACLANAQQRISKGNSLAEIQKTSKSLSSLVFSNGQASSKDTISSSAGLAHFLLSLNPASAVKISRSHARSPVKHANTIARSAPAIASAGDTIHGWPEFSLSRVTETLKLALLEEINSSPVAGADVQIKSYEGVGAPNVKWCSGLQLKGSDVTLSSLCGFCGPLTDVPNLIASCGISDGSIHLYIDWRPRADGAYDPSYATLADYPEPDSREAFAASGIRKDFEAAFYTDEVAKWREALFALDGATPAAPLTKEQVGVLSASPMLVDIRLPLTESSATAATKACMEAVDRWLGWMTSAKEMKRELPAGFKQTATLTRDGKVAQDHFVFLQSRYSSLFGRDAGTQLAVHHAGPLDEAYIGGGS